MKLGLMQPYFMPYIGYWQRIHAVDEHVIYDDVNYIKGGWMNRNRIIFNGNVQYFNVPLKGASPNKLINEVQIDANPVLQGKMLKTLEYAYKKAPYYYEAMSVLEPILTSKEENLARYLECELREISRYLGITTKIVLSSSIAKDNSLKGQDKVIEICHRERADIYINASTGEHLYDRGTFRENGIDLVFIKDAGTVHYRQTLNDFVPALSIIDVMMNCSQDEMKKLLDDYITY